MTVNDNPLWRFALAVYPASREILLDWQDKQGAHVNDLLWLAYAYRRDLTVNWPLWHRVEAGKPRQLLRRVRALRKRLERTDPARERALQWELELEAIDLCLLYACIGPNHNQTNRRIDPLAHYWGVEEPALAALVERLAGWEGDEG